MEETFEFKGKTYKIENHNISDTFNNKVCDLCDLKGKLCNDFIDEKLWIACGSIFADSGYICKLLKNN